MEKETKTDWDKWALSREKESNRAKSEGSTLKNAYNLLHFISKFNLDALAFWLKRSIKLCFSVAAVEHRLDHINVIPFLSILKLNQFIYISRCVRRSNAPLSVSVDHHECNLCQSHKLHMMRMKD